MTPISTALGGALLRHADGWRWRDGTPAPQCRDMLLSHLAPNFRCSTFGEPRRSYVEIAHDWREPLWWPDRCIDDQAAAEIERLIGDAGEPAKIYAEGLAELIDDHRVTRHGYLVPIEQWNAAMRQPCGVWWTKDAEPEILARSRAFGWRG